MPEIELKLQVAAARRAAVRAQLGRAAAARPQRLRAVYVDTPRGALAAAGLALRVRHEGAGWVQTLKGAGADLLTRHEHEVARPGAPARPPRVDPGLHRGTEVGDRLLALLDAARERDPGEMLEPRYATDVTRLARIDRRAGERVETVYDSGEIRAGDARWPLSEIEIELKTGRPATVVEVARAWVDRHAVWLDTRSKAERGSLLAAGQRIAPAAAAASIALTPDLDIAQAWRVALRECLRQIGANASQIASDEYGPEHVHQLRVGLRRLRSVARLFDASAAALASAAPARALFRALGEVRDAALAGGVLADAAARAAQVRGAPPGRSAAVAAAAPVDVAETIRSALVQHWLLDLIAASVETGADDPDLRRIALVDHVASRLNRWHRKAAADALGYRELDDAGRHRLRRRVKRLRYAIEFSAALFERKARERYLKRLRALQERLGQIADLTVARASLLADPAPDAAAGFMLGWLDAKREALIDQALPALERFAEAPRFWKQPRSGASAGRPS